MIDSDLIRQATGLDVPAGLVFQEMGMLFLQRPGMLAYLADRKYFGELENNPNVRGVFTTAELAPDVEQLSVAAIISPEPRLAYTLTQNYLVEHRPLARFPSQIAASARIHPRAYVAENNVIIGEGTQVGPNASILEGVEMGEHCIIQANAVLGAEGYEYQRTSQGFLLVRHGGRVLLGNAVEVGACAVIDRAVFDWDATVVGDETKIDNLVHVAHAVKLGKGCMIIAGAILCGSIEIRDRARVGPGAVISNGVCLEPDSVVSLGAVATRSVASGQRVSGNFAIEHDKLMQFIKTIR